MGDNLFLKLKQVENSVMLDHSIFGYFERCSHLNEILSEENYFLRFYERRNKFRYQLRQKLQTSNKIRRELLACVIQKFNGYELLRNHLYFGKKKDFKPTDIVYEPTLDTKKPILCFFAPEVHSGYQTGVEKTKNCEKVMNRTTAKQCHYCSNYFVKSAEKKKKHLS